MKALEILKKIYANNPDTRFQRNNIDINFTIHDFSNVNEAIKELEALENKFKREQENNLSSEITKTETILGLKKYIEALDNRCCESCIYEGKSNCKNCLSCKRQYSDNWRNK